MFFPAATTYLRNSYGMENCHSATSKPPLLVSPSRKNETQELPTVATEAVCINDSCRDLQADDEFSSSVMSPLECYLAQCYHLSVRKPNSTVCALFESLAKERIPHCCKQSIIWNDKNDISVQRHIPLLKFDFRGNFLGPNAGFTAFCETLQYFLQIYLPAATRGDDAFDPQRPHYGLDIDFRDNHLTTENIKSLIKALFFHFGEQKNMYVITSLRAEGNKLNHEAGTALLRLVRFNKSILRLVLYSDTEKQPVDPYFRTNIKLASQIDFQCSLNCKEHPTYSIADM